MARTYEIKRLLSTAGTGHSYIVKRGTKGDKKYMVAAESVALDCLGYKVERDVKPGETVFIDMKKNIHFHDYNQKYSYSPCIFEYVYLARPDSVIDEINVYQSRLEMGKKLADKIKCDLTKEELINSKFVYSTSYKVQDKHSDTIKTENKVIENLMDKIYQEILIKLTEITK